MKRTRKVLSSVLVGIGVLAMTAIPAMAEVGPVLNMENYNSTLPINGQDGWSALGAAGLGCAEYDQHFVTNINAPESFGAVSLRMSDGVTSGCFGDQVFSKPLNNAVGESSSTYSSFDPGETKRYLHMQFDIASTTTNFQPGMHVSVSPDRGDGSRMSYLRFEDSISGINVFFDDILGKSNPANFHETQIASDLIRTQPHKVDLTFAAFNGPSNDVVKVWIDNDLKITGTSWENYYRFDTEASAEQSPRIVKTVLFRESGTANNANSGNGYLFDNLSLTSGDIPGGATTMEECKNGGWSTISPRFFRNQGDCVSSIASQGKSKGNTIANLLFGLFH